MILRIIVENFLSFREATQFDMFPNLKRTTFENHIYKDKEIPLLKQAAIYGANGSGKSNFIWAIEFIRKYALDTNFLNSISVSEYKHKLAESTDTAPISLFIEFSTPQNYYIYTIDIADNSIENESLYLSGVGKKENELIFSRKGELIRFAEEPTAEVRSAIDTLINDNAMSSVLSLNNRFPIIKDKRAAEVYNWFAKDLEVVSFNAAAPQLIDFMSENSEVLSFAKEAFTEIGLGINDLSIRTEQFDEWIRKKEHSQYKSKEKQLSSDNAVTGFAHNKPLFSIGVDNGIRTVKEFVFKQLGKNGYIGELDIKAQSDGTVRLLTLIPALYSAIKLGHTVVIDEINHSIHPSLIFALINYYANTATTGQLIFTTHETCLLNQQQLMRPDEVWFTEKNEGATRMYSLNEFKVHSTISIENGYMQGRYGAIPFIGTLD